MMRGTSPRSSIRSADCRREVIGIGYCGTPVTLTAHGNGDSVTLASIMEAHRFRPNVLPFVSEPLARGRGESAGHGIGLGLFIARAIVVGHGGNIQASSSADAGTTFTVSLPKT